MQLSPHTLFNLLHTIRGNIEWDPRGAQAMVVQLADLLRRLLSAGERDFSRLTDELQFVAMYLELQQKRFPDRLRLLLPDTARVPAVWVPSLILQPLVENAVVHGLAGHQGPVTVSIEASVSGDKLTVSVVNTAVGLPRRGTEGIGLKNVRERLAVQFGARGTLQTGLQDRTWFATIQLPCIQAVPIAAGVRGMVAS
jgi:LytS/YehU family sensor histidine kinase